MAWDLFFVPVCVYRTSPDPVGQPIQAVLLARPVFVSDGADGGRGSSWPTPLRRRLRRRPRPEQLTEMIQAVLLARPVFVSDGAYGGRGSSWPTPLRRRLRRRPRPE